MAKHLEPVVGLLLIIFKGWEKSLTTYMAPSACYVDDLEVDEEVKVEQDDSPSNSPQPQQECVPETQGVLPQYFVDSESDSRLSSGDSSTKSDKEHVGNGACRNLFPLLLVESHPCRTAQGGEPLIDYSQSILMTRMTTFKQ